MKLDIGQIEGYEQMTDADKVRALEALELPETDTTGMVKKELLDRATHEAADWRKKFNELTNSDKKQQTAASAELDTLRNQVKELQRERAIADYTAQLVGQGYSAELAGTTAAALHDGDMAAVFKAQQTFIAAHDKALRAELLKDTPEPPAGIPYTGTDGGYAQKAQEALARGDRSAAVYYTRLAQTAQG